MTIDWWYVLGTPIAIIVAGLIIYWLARRY
jgi:hypothetical protein